jgi:hypothetical protein
MLCHTTDAYGASSDSSCHQTQGDSDEVARCRNSLRKSTTHEPVRTCKESGWTRNQPQAHPSSRAAVPKPYRRIIVSRRVMFAALKTALEMFSMGGGDMAESAASLAPTLNLARVKSGLLRL